MFLSKKNIHYLFLIFLFIYFLPNLYSQMPGWITHVDEDGNKYFVDRTLKIWTSEKPEFNYRAVSNKARSYYLNQGIALINNHYKVEGLTLLKSVRLLADFYPEALFDGKKASVQINKFIKNEGDRFKKLNNQASLLMVKNKSEIVIYNDLMSYVLKINANVDVLKRKIIYKHKYLRYGVMLGVNLNEKLIHSENKEKTKYDFLVYINSEKFHYKIKTIEKYEEICRNKLPGNTFIKKIFKISSKTKEYLFEDKNSTDTGYQGYEGYQIDGTKGYFIRIIAQKKGFQKYKDKILLIVDNFKVSNYYRKN